MGDFLTDNCDKNVNRRKSFY